MVFIMSKICKRCNVTILDDAMKCPLCNGVLEGADSDKSESLTYPDISTSLRKMQFIIRIVVFLAIIAFVTVVIVNYATFNGVYWSLLVGAELCYGCFVLIYIFHERRSLQRMIIGQMLAAAVVLLLTDFLVGWQGWSLSIALPITFLGVDVTAFVLMVVAIDGWQSYIMTEIGTFLLNSILLALVGTHDWSRFSMIMNLVSTGITFVILLGTIMLGGKMISNELYRRFRV